MSDLEARDSNGKQKALEHLTKIIAVGEDAQQVVIKRAMERVITDKLVPPAETKVNVHGKDVFIQIAGNNRGMAATNLALNQICKTLDIPKLYVNRLLEECVGMDEAHRHDLLETIFNTHFSKGDFRDRKKHSAKFLHRYMNGKLHAFLTRSYNRMLGTAMMMRPFLEECAVAGARPSEANHDDAKTSLKCVQPIIYEPVDGEFIAFGVTYTNSDFGAGSLVVSGSVLRVMSGTTSVLDSQMKKVHLGALIKDSDIDLSQETMLRESQAHASAVKDMVRDVFSEKNIQQTLDLVRFSIEHKISWSNLVSRAKEFLGKAELEMLNQLLISTKDEVIDLPPVTLNTNGDPEANAWWAAAALGRIASTIPDVERKVGLQELAGDLLK